MSGAAGLIDAGYRGPLVGLFDNIKSFPYTVKRGDRLLQAVSFDGSEISFEVSGMSISDKLSRAQIVEQLDDTARGQDGIGSTGK